MPRASREQSEQTARTVRATARRLFADLGFAAVGLEQVAAEAGVTRGAVYHHFGSKQALFTAVLADVQAAVAAQVGRAAPGDGWEAIEAGCRAFLRASLAPEVRRVMLLDGPAVLGWAEWRRLDAEHSGRLLEQGLAGLTDLAVDPAAAAALLSGAMNEAALWVAEGGDREAAESGLQRLVGSLRRRPSDADGPPPATAR
ncbi:TetR/AcrR family transcriptional regulator [Desertihabitans aurantiacus]|uniref:TetR/AcrR family transcriptional regulator n=1 Tax=Desertihabitans aurantiacus TaxID=2282477 RepID=UPI000DF72CDF|nr:TetR/AcrR family transcriptional regulator [Desertihabitans aurantiacus]